MLLMLDTLTAGSAILWPPSQLASCPCLVILLICGHWDFLNALREQVWGGDVPESGGITQGRGRRKYLVLSGG